MYISLFAEERIKGSDNWTLIGNDSICGDIQGILLPDDVDDEESNYHLGLFDITEDFEDIDETELSKELLDLYEGGFNNQYVLKTCPIGEYQSRINAVISKYSNNMACCYKALGISVKVRNDDWNILDCYGEDQKKYTSSGDIRKNYNQLTFPVDKELFLELNRISGMFCKAMRWGGILMTIREIAVNPYDSDIRLVFVRSI